MRIIIIFFLAFLSLLPAHSAVNLSSNAKISLLTCSPGKDLYALYGHSAIRVKDEAHNLDVVFNYGTFDFNTPNFYLKFANGRLNYMLSVSNFSHFLQNYFHEERSVWQQQLNLDSLEKQRLFDTLVYTSLPENRFYRYDFFFDNCATRIRDVVYQSIGSEVFYKDSTEVIRSFRSYIHEYEKDKPWVQEGLDILLGLQTDDPAFLEQQMFLPDYMMLYFGKAYTQNNSGLGFTRELVQEMEPLLRFENEKTSSSLLTPVFVFWLVLAVLIILTAIELRLKKRFLIVDRFLWLLTGLIGVLIVFLWFFTLHQVTANNFNILWAMPLNVVLAFLPRRSFKGRLVRSLLILNVVLLGVLMVFKFAIPQELPAFVFPFCIGLFIRTSSLLIRQ